MSEQSRSESASETERESESEYESESETESYNASTDKQVLSKLYQQTTVSDNCDKLTMTDQSESESETESCNTSNDKNVISRHSAAICVAAAAALVRSNRSNSASHDATPSTLPDNNNDEPTVEQIKSILEELRMAFTLLDRNHDGRVNAAEIRAMLDNLGIQGFTNDRIRTVIRQASANGENILEESDFLKFMQRFRSPSPSPPEASTSTPAEEDLHQDLMAAFMIFDKDRNGYITKEELRNAMSMIGEPMSESELDDLLRLSDIDNDGKIDYQEFLKALLED